jgi:hypothetical protein
LNVSAIRALAKKPDVHIFVIFDEIDKFGGTDARLIELFEIVNLLSEVGAQIIATSNQSPAQIKERWKYSEHTDPILRRFYDDTGGTPRRMLVCALPLVSGLTVQPVGAKRTTDAPFELQVATRSKGVVTYTVLSGPADIQKTTEVRQTDAGKVKVEVSRVQLTGVAGEVKVEVSQGEWKNYGGVTTTVNFEVVTPP